MENLLSPLSLGGRIVVVSGAGGGGIGTTVTAPGRAGGGDGGRSQPIQGQPRRARRTVDRRGTFDRAGARRCATDDGIASTLEAVRRTEGELYGLVNVAGGAAPTTWMPSTRVIAG